MEQQAGEGLLCAVCPSTTHHTPSQSSKTSRRSTDVVARMQWSRIARTLGLPLMAAVAVAVAVRHVRCVVLCQVNHLHPSSRLLLPQLLLLLLPQLPLLLLLLRGVAVHGRHGLAGLAQDHLVEGRLRRGEAKARLLRGEARSEDTYMHTCTRGTSESLPQPNND